MDDGQMTAGVAGSDGSREKIEKKGREETKWRERGVVMV